MEALDPERVTLRGLTMIEASAGTGKTYTITSLFLRLLLEADLQVDQILVVTYTRAATAELRDRIRKRLALALALARATRSEPAADDPLLGRLCARAAERFGQAALCARLERALAGVDEAPVLTIHAFCQRVLRDYAFESGSAFDTQLTVHAAPLLDEIADDYFVRELYETTPLRARVLLREPELLRRLAARVGGRGLCVVPAHVDEHAFDLDAWQGALADCRALFAAEREPIVEQVRGLRGVGQNAIKYAQLVAELLAAGEPGGFLEKASFLNFTRSGAAAKARAAPPAHPFFEAAERLLGLAQAYAQAAHSAALGFRRRFVDYVDQELARRTRESSVRTFDALLGDLDRALSGPHGAALGARLRAKYRAALVDEFQDTDPTQYRIFRSIFGDTMVGDGAAPWLLIGDPKQAIYGFRGADLAAYLAARADAAERVYTLEVNWRSDPALIEALNRLYSEVEQPFLSEQIAYRRVRAPLGCAPGFHARDARAPIDLALLSAEDGNTDALRHKVARHLAADIVALLGSGATRRAREPGARVRPLAPSELAVLCRTNHEAALVQLALSERGVPCALSGDASVFDSEDVPQLERALGALAHPGDARALRSFLASLYGGFDAPALLELEADDARWERQREQLQALHETWLTHGFMPALRALVVAYDIEAKLLARSDGPRRVTNLWHLAELLAEAAATERLGPLGLCRWLALVQRDAALRAELAGDAHELRLERGGDAVTITTVHKSKGLEYPIVYCPFLWTAAELPRSERELVRFHDPERGGALTLDLGSSAREGHAALARDEALAEALRLLYVGLTRAQHRVTLIVPSSDKLAQSALGYLLFGGGDPGLVKQQIAGLLKAGQLESELGTRSERAERSFSVRKLESAEAARYCAQAPESPSLRARRVRRGLDQTYRVASFSALSAERGAHAEAGLDRDAQADPSAPQAEPEAPSELALAAFPRGALAGQLVHEVLEHAQFDGSTAALAELTERVVRARGYPAELAPSLALGLARALATPLDESGFRLSQLARGARIDEMEFLFPVERTLTPASLARLFRAHGAPAAHPSYARALRELGFEAMHGYLRGYIDLVFRFQGRFYLVDYKSNWLGARADHYAQDALAEAMADHHYFLQYHLYALALHRYLGQRVRDYAYERHFGGVYYLFLRGMAPEHPPFRGVFRDRPAAALIDALDSALRPSTAAREPRTSQWTS